MIKIVSPGGWTFDEPVSQLVRVSSRGLRGEDKTAFVKRAGAVAPLFLSQMDKVAIGPGDVLCHEIILGATEGWSANRNGDGFKEADCIEHHPTFTKFAKAFRNHKNKPGDPTYGVIKLSAYNPVMRRVELLTALNSTKEAADRNGGFVADREIEALEKDGTAPLSMACFAPGAMVRTVDGEKPIESVQVGDRVMTHHGNIGTVNATMNRPYVGDVFRIRVSGLPDEIVCTPNHRIWVRPTAKGKTPRCPVCGRQFKGLQAHLRQMKDPQHAAAYRDYGKAAEGWCASEQMTVGDYVRTPFDTTVDAPGDPVYAELLGYYLAEGSSFHHKRQSRSGVRSVWADGIDFSFGSTEQHLVDRAETLVKTLGYTRTHVYRRRNNVLLLRVSSLELADRLERDGGRYSHAKRIAPEIMRWSPAVQAKLFAAFADGDGTFNSTLSHLRSVTASRTLAFQLAEIGYRLGIPCRVARNVPKPGQATKRPWYGVDVQADWLHLVPCRKIPAGFVPPQPRPRNIGHLRHQTDATVTCTRAAKVLSYVEHGFVYRRVFKVVRDEYAGLVYNLSVPGDTSYTVGSVGVANCKIAFDVCQACGNRARNRSEYCTGSRCKAGGCRDNLGKVVKVGSDMVHVYVDNPNPLWFDRSFVGRPADRTAYGTYADWFSKAAADNGCFPTGGAEAADVLNICAPTWLSLHSDDPLLALRTKMAYALAGWELHPPADDPALGLAIGRTPIKEARDLPSYLMALADRSVVLSLADYATITKRAGLLERARPLLRGAAGRMIADATLPAKLAAVEMRDDDEPVSLDIHKTASAVAAARSLQRDNVERRACKAAIAGETVQFIADSAVADAEGEALARDYTAYKIAALTRIARFDENFLLTVHLVDCQNRVL